MVAGAGQDLAIDGRAIARRTPRCARPATAAIVSGMAARPARIYGIPTRFQPDSQPAHALPDPFKTEIPARHGRIL
ncbi:hypothetical protein GCM10007856_09150 [Azospirillum oryzae]|nr:hypothetical protein GCM10007856_09150 [Azospirillum oryzae]